MRVGFIGLGSQGGPMARRIVEAGYETTLLARRAGSLEPYADTAAKTAGSPAELAAASDLVCGGESLSSAAEIGLSLGNFDQGKLSLIAR